MDMAIIVIPQLLSLGISLSNTHELINTMPLNLYACKMKINKGSNVNYKGMLDIATSKNLIA